MSIELTSDDSHTDEVWVFPHLEKDPLTISPALPSAELEQEKAELHHMKTLLQGKIAIVENIIGSMNTLYTQIDNELWFDIIDVIRKAVKKIIQKELALDNELLKNLVHQAMESVEDKKQCSVFLSEKDYKELTFTLSTISEPIKIDKNLQPGDFIISTPREQIVAIIDEQISTILDIDNAM